MRPDLDHLRTAFPAGRPGSAAIRRLCDFIEYLESQFPKTSDDAWKLFMRIAKEERVAKAYAPGAATGPVPDEEPPGESGTPQGGG